MRTLLEAIRTCLRRDESDDEDETVTDWLDSHQPAKQPLPDLLPGEGWDGTKTMPVEDEDLVTAVALAARMLRIDSHREIKIDEDRLRDRLCRALDHLTPAVVVKERSVPIRDFQGVGGIDVVLRDPEGGSLCGMIECKLSIQPGQDKIFETAWDAIKLVLAGVDQAYRWIVTCASQTAWSTTEIPDLFSDGEIDTRELWSRRLHKKGPNGGTTVGEDCELGGRGNMFTDAPEFLEMKFVASTTVPGTDWMIRAARVVAGKGRNVHFHDPPEFPRRIDQRWLDEHVPPMPEDQFQSLLQWLKLKRWTDQEILSRVQPLRE